MIQLFEFVSGHAQAWMAAAAFLIGCILGSFLNVVGLRLPAKQSIVYPPSHCVHCNHSLNAVDLLPVLGWFIRLGKCHYCGRPISPIYPLGELATGAGFAMATLYIDHAAERFLAYFLVVLLVVLSVSDLKHRLLPDRFIFPAMAVALLVRLLYHPLPLWEYLLGFLIGGGVLFLVGYIGAIIRPQRTAMGGGDIKLMALLGLVLGAKLAAVALIVSSFAGLAIGIAVIAAGRIKRKTPIPFGPFLALGGTLALLFGNGWTDWYWSHLSLMSG